MAVIISGSVDTSTAGSYEIKYNASDTAGNVALEVIRTVNIGTGTTPSLTMLLMLPGTMQWK
ncbi:TPA: hypothetical protein DCZ09_02170 [Candidatus Nomurabacteria bacterium]|nr:hypothetical protein [Candidatus Nomurabacteria bacterium]